MNKELKSIRKMMYEQNENTSKEIYIIKGTKQIQELRSTLAEMKISPESLTVDLSRKNKKIRELKGKTTEMTQSESQGFQKEKRQRMGKTNISGNSG